MNPNQHGEVFVTFDGCETDLDLGHYERFTEVKTTKNKDNDSKKKSESNSAASSTKGEVSKKHEGNNQKILNYIKQYVA